MKKRTKIILGVDLAIVGALLIVVPVVVIVPYCSTTTTSFLEKNANKTFDVTKDNGRNPNSREMLYAFLYYLWNNNTEDQNRDKLNYNLIQSEYQYTVYDNSTSTKAKCFTFHDSIKLYYLPSFNEKVFYTKNAVLKYEGNVWKIQLLKNSFSMRYPRFDADGKLIHIFERYNC